MGVIFAFLSADCWGISNSFIKRAQENTSYSIHIGTFLTIIVNNLINILIVSIVLLTQGPPELEEKGVWLFAIGGLLNSCIGRSLLFVCFGHIGAARGGVLKGVMPLLVILGGVAFLNEHMNTNVWLGVILVLCGVFTISIDTMRQSRGGNSIGSKKT